MNYEQYAKELNIEVATLKAVREVESGGTGFLTSGEPVILFEPHVFWRQLKEREINPHLYTEGNADILYEKWGTHPYPPSSKQHARLARAVEIHREAALCSASWGLFQIMGYHYKACGCKTIQEYVNAMYKSEDEHLRTFVNFLKTMGYDKYLRAKNWEGFARVYNGPAYAKHNYHKKLNTAYIKHSK